jgi:hypothetical protein
MGLGYSGFMRLGGENGTVMLTTGGGLNLVLEPIYSNAVWGAGWYNASSGHYADGALRYEGSVDAEMQATTTIWNFIRDWAIERNLPGG